jgi:hypothetical protein
MIKKIFLLLFIAFSMFVYAEEIVTTSDGRQIILFDDNTWAEKANETGSQIDVVSKFKNKLRKNIEATDIEVKIACEMMADGWKYTMPRPKSAKAGWGISDGRTTWWNGYWYNDKTKLYSEATPVKKSSGLFLGDNQNNSGTWRNGGSPQIPDVYMFLLSDFGGPY